MEFEEFLGLRILGETLEKGSSREHTGNRVTRWEIMFLGEFGFLR
jgi:hypothetical protein